MLAKKGRYSIFGLTAKAVLMLGYSVLMFVTGFVTLQYPPGYLHLPWLWASMAGASGILMVGGLFTRANVELIQAAGWATALTASSRGFAIFLEVAQRGWPREPAEWSFVVASVQWQVMALTLAIIWSFAPWAWGLPSVDHRPLDDVDV